MAEYDGVLKQRFPSISLLSSECDLAEYHRAVDEREATLFAHFGIDRTLPDAWRNLALALARRHVPAFMPERGRPVTKRGEALKWLIASLYFQLRDGASKASADRLVAEHFGVDPSAVGERLKELRRHDEYKEDGPLLTVIAGIEAEFGRQALLECLAEVLTPDPDFAEYVKREAQKLL